MKASLYTLPLHFGKLLKGSEGGQSKPQIDIPFLLRSINTGELNFDAYPTQNFNLDQINDAILLLKTGVAGRMIINL
jgi:Zn-dependent alcohol dehydrogenase